MFLKIDVLKSFPNFTGKLLCRSLFLKSLQDFIQKVTNKVFSCEVWEIFNNIFLQNTSCDCFCTSSGGCSSKKGVVEISQNSQKNTCARVFFWIKLHAQACNFIKKENLAQVFFCEFCEISKNTLSYRTPPVTASIGYWLTENWYFLTWDQ